MNELKKKFPLLMPINHKLTEFYGYLNILDENFKIHIILSEAGSLKNLKLLGNWQLQQLLKKSEFNIIEQYERCNTLTEFLLELQNHLEQLLRSENKSHSIPLLPAYYGMLLRQLETCGWEKLKYIDDTWSKVHLSAVDDLRRLHILQLTIPNEYPSKAPEIICDLPSSDVSWSKNKSLREIYEEFQLKLKDYQLFWDCMDEIDNKVWVLEPSQPSRKDCKRRIAIAPNTSLQINVDPNHPTEIPECYFYGPEKTIGPLRELLHSNLEQWDKNSSLLTNLQSVLDVTFPLQSDTTKEDLHMECGICYSYEMNNMLPDILCENTKCLQPFHHCCLYEWLKTLPTTRHSFNILFGECPYCDQSIICKNMSI